MPGKPCIAHGCTGDQTCPECDPIRCAECNTCQEHMEMLALFAGIDPKTAMCCEAEDSRFSGVDCEWCARRPATRKFGEFAICSTCDGIREESVRSDRFVDGVIAAGEQHPDENDPYWTEFWRLKSRSGQ